MFHRIHPTAIITSADSSKAIDPLSLTQFFFFVRLVIGRMVAKPL